MKEFVFNKGENHIVVAGHRGAKSLYPENTMLSYINAINLGVDQLEIDVNVTKDGKLVLIHDTSLDRTTDRVGAVRDFTLAEIKQADAGQGERIPQFFELLDYIKNSDITLNVEIKDKTTECVDKIMDTLQAYPMQNRFVIACWDANFTKYAYEKYGVPTQGFPKEIWQNYEIIKRGYPHSIGIPMERLTRELCEEYRSIGVEPWCWCPDDEASVIKAVEVGARLMTCNDPRPALKILREMGRHD